MMYDYEALQHVLTLVRDGKEDLSAQLETGGIENWSMYQNVVGQLQSLAYIESEVQSWLKRLDGEDE